MGGLIFWVVWSFREVKAGGCTPEVYAVVPCDIEVPDSMLEAVVMDFSWSGIRLREFNASECNIRAAGCHSPDQLANARPVS